MRPRPDEVGRRSHQASFPISSALCARIIAIVVAAAAAIWGVVTYPAFWADTKIAGVAAQIAAGEPFKRENLTELRPDIDALESASLRTPESVHNVALIELRLAEMDYGAGEKIGTDPQFVRARHAIEEALRAVPSDSFMWFSLFWVAKTRDGFSAALIPYLRMSYRYGPEEGWIILRRNRVVVPLLSVLPPDIVAHVVKEFRQIVEMPMYVNDAVDILTNVGWDNRATLIAGLRDVPEDAKRQFARAIYKLGYDVAIPGVEERKGVGPWR